MSTSELDKGAQEQAISGGITTEDRRRARDRWNVRNARAKGRGRSLNLLWLLIGPGILVMLGENDGPSMISYAQTGATYGVGFFIPFILFTFAMAFVVQEMTVRLGAATKRGHAELIYERFGRFWGFFSLADLVFLNFLTLVTEFIAVRAGLGFFGVPPALAVLGAFMLIVGVTMSQRYWTWERITLGLAVFNLVFVPVAIMAHPVGTQVVSAFLTFGPLPGGVNAAFVLLVMSNIGATVTPWMLFFQQSAVVDKGLTTADLRQGRIDTALGAVFAATAAIATILATAPLFSHHIQASSFQGAEFAQALIPFLGKTAASLFALGIFEAGIVAAATISLSSAYAFGEVTGRSHSLNSGLRDAWPFYAVVAAAAGIAAVLVLIPHAPLVFIVLIVNVIAVLAMPPAIVFLILLVNDREIMGEYANGRWSNFLGIGVTVILVLAGLIYGITTIFPHLLKL
ncbi:MAG: divalent metal cation transporter [Capsulimonadaceae bacterium]|nr:divalent metal cation transporter [Capsulimonadaceae bacterium]